MCLTSVEQVINFDFLQVKATDADMGVNAYISYSITQDQMQGYQPFTVNSQTGQLYTTSILDREESAKYTLTIKASNTRSSLQLYVNTTFQIKFCTPLLLQFLDSFFNLSFNMNTPKNLKEDSSDDGALALLAQF